MKRRILIGAALAGAALAAVLCACSGAAKPTPSPSAPAEESSKAPESEPPTPAAPEPTVSPAPTPEPALELKTGSLERAERTYTYSGQEVERKFYYYIPSAWQEGERLPIMLSLHGSGSNAYSQLLESRYHEFAEEYGFILIAPEAVAIHSNGKLSSAGKLLYETGQSDAKYLRWNAVPSTDPCNGYGVDDVTYLLDLVDIFVDQGYGDTGRVYSSGLSHGAFMSLRLALEAPGRIAGVGAVAGLLSADFLDTVMSEKVKIVFVEGTADPIVPIAGMNYNGFQYAYSLKDSVKWFLEQYGMEDAQPEETALPDTDPDDGTTITRSVYSDTEGTPWIFQYVVEGGGHTWPGGTQYGDAKYFGIVSRDADASLLILENLGLKER